MRYSTMGVIAAVVLAVGLAAAACGDDDNSSTPTSGTTASPAATATLGATAAPTARPTTTGIASVDAAIRAVLANDAAALKSQFAYFKVNCSTNPSGGFPFPPKCSASEADGTPVDVFLKVGRRRCLSETRRCRLRAGGLAFSWHGALRGQGSPVVGRRSGRISIRTRFCKLRRRC